MKDQAIWRGSAVKVLSANVKSAVVVTPCGYALRVRVAELQAMKRRRVKLDSTRF